MQKREPEVLAEGYKPQKMATILPLVWPGPENETATSPSEPRDQRRFQGQTKGGMGKGRDTKYPVISFRIGNLLTHPVLSTSKQTGTLRARAYEPTKIVCTSNLPDKLSHQSVHFNFYGSLLEIPSILPPHLTFDKRVCGLPHEIA